MPHTVTEDLARQPSVTVDKITPTSVRQFLRRSKADVTRFAVTGRPDAAGMGREQLSDTDILLEILEYCLSDCPPPGERPPGISIGRDGRSGSGDIASAAAEEGRSTVEDASRLRAVPHQAIPAASIARAFRAMRAAQGQPSEVDVVADSEVVAGEAAHENDDGDTVEMSTQAMREQAMKVLIEAKGPLGELR